MCWDEKAFKRCLLKIFDRSYLDVYQLGAKKLTVDILEDRILILSSHTRLPGLRALDTSNRFVTRMADVALMDEHKLRFTQLLTQQLPQLRVRSILSDYDPEKELAAMVIVLEQKPELSLSPEL